jgi:hypothetical protein
MESGRQRWLQAKRDLPDAGVTKYFAQAVSIPGCVGPGIEIPTQYVSLAQSPWQLLPMAGFQANNWENVIPYVDCSPEQDAPVAGVTANLLQDEMMPGCVGADAGGVDVVGEEEPDMPTQ